MEDYDYREGKEGVKATAEQLWAPGEDDNGVVRDGDYGGDQDDHEVAQGLEAGAKLERVYLHPRMNSAAYPDFNLGDDWPSRSAREQAFPDVRSQV